MTFTKDATNTVLRKSALQDVVEDMHAYHARTGAYRPADVFRVIGDQRKGIGLSVPPKSQEKKKDNK